jgi:hypothetical protein
MLKNSPAARAVSPLHSLRSWAPWARMVMTPEQKTGLAQGLAFGLFFQFLGDFIKEVSRKPDAPYYGGAVAEIMGYVIFAWGCTHLVTAKRLPKWTSLLGFLSVIGLAILLVLPDRSPKAGTSDAPSPAN